MILVTKTSDQTRQWGHTLSTCTNLTWALSTLCSPPCFLVDPQVIRVGSYWTNPFFSTFFSLSTHVSPVSRTASTAILRFLALFCPPSALPNPILVPVIVVPVCVCVFSSHSFWTSMGVPAGVTQEEGHTGFFIHLLSAVRAFIFLARRIQPFLSLVDREVELYVLTI